MIRCLLALLAIVAAPAWALDPAGWSANLSGATVQIPPASYTRQGWATAATADGVKLTAEMGIPAPGGRSATAKIVASASKKAILTHGAKALASAIPAVGTAALLYDLYEALRVKPAPGGAPGIVNDPGQEADQEQRTVFVADSTGCKGATPIDVPTCVLPQLRAQMGAQGRTVVSVDAPVCDNYGNGNFGCRVAVWHCLMDYNASPPNCQGGYPVAHGWSDIVYAKVATVPVCPAYVDFFYPAGSHYGRDAAKPGSDGKCPSGQWQGISPEDAADLAGHGQYAAEMYKQWLDEALGVLPMPASAGGPVAVESVTPSTIEGPTTSTSGPEGTVQEAVKWDFGSKSQDLRAKMDAGKWNEVKTRTTTSLSGESTTTTTKTENQTDTEKAEEKGDQCALHPDSLGCMTVGEVPTVDDPPSREVNITGAPQSGWGAADGACPTPTSVSVLGQHVEIDNSLLCKFVGGIRFAVIGCCALVAAGILGLGLKP